QRRGCAAPVDHAESPSAGPLWRATRPYMALRLLAEDTGPREQHTPSTAHLSAWPDQKRARSDVGLRSWGVDNSGEGGGGGDGPPGSLSSGGLLNDSDRNLVAGSSGHGECVAGWSRGAIPSGSARATPAGA